MNIVTKIWHGLTIALAISSVRPTDCKELPIIPGDRNFKGYIQPYSDTVFLPTKNLEGRPAFFSQADISAFEEFMKYCIHNTGSITAGYSSYMGYCEIEEGSFRQHCTFGALKTDIICGNPAAIPGKKVEPCQEEFIEKRFHHEGGRTLESKGFFNYVASFFHTQPANENCAYRVNSIEKTADEEYCHTHISSEGEETYCRSI